jgi:hypothetical protein
VLEAKVLGGPLRVILSIKEVQKGILLQEHRMLGLLLIQTFIPAVLSALGILPCQ